MEIKKYFLFSPKKRRWPLGGGVNGIMFFGKTLQILSRLGRAKNSCYQCYFVFFKIYYHMISQKNYHIFITSIKSPWSELSNGILVDVWVQKLTPNQPISNCDPAIASSISFFCVPHKNLQHHQPTLPGAETIPSMCSCLNSLFVWFQCWVWLADGVVSWQHNTMFDQRQ